jgi:hypothetical protein
MNFNLRKHDWQCGWMTGGSVIWAPSQSCLEEHIMKTHLRSKIVESSVSVASLYSLPIQ